MSNAKQDAYIHKLAKRNLAEQSAILCEPRCYYDVFTFPLGTEVVFGNPDVFRNGERFPLRITHLTMAMLYTGDDQETPPLGDERMVQRYGLRIKAHGTYYQNSVFTPLPLYANVPVATSPVTSTAQATWKLDKPFIMANRDAMEIMVQLIVAPSVGTTERVTASLEGIGFYSKQPKVFRGTLEISDAGQHTLDIDQFRNDGTEPFELHQITIHQAAPATRSDPIGNVANVRFRMRNNGNGTNQWWTLGPTTGSQFVPAPLCGIGVSRAVVHKLPGDGWLWYPNEGVLPEVRSFDTTRAAGESVLLGFVGYIAVQ